MPFWKKSEDPWDYEPEKPSRPAEPGQEGKDCAPSLMDELRDWNEERREKKRQRETPPPMACPWCGQEMEAGYLTGGRGVFWTQGVPTTKKLLLGAGEESTLRMDAEGGLLPYGSAWLCRACRRMVMEIPEEEIPKPPTPEEAAEQMEEQRQQEAQRKIDRGLQG